MVWTVLPHFATALQRSLVSRDAICLQVARLEKQIAAASATKEAAGAKMARESACMARVKEHVAASKEAALAELRAHLVSPPATMHVLTATLRLLGKPEDTYATWTRAARHYFNDALFADLDAYDAAQERDVGVWRGVRAAYKAVEPSTAPQQWAFEMPQTALGALLKVYIKQVRAPWSPACVCVPCYVLPITACGACMASGRAGACTRCLYIKQFMAHQSREDHLNVAAGAAYWHRRRGTAHCHGRARGR